MIDMMNDNSQMSYRIRTDHWDFLVTPRGGAVDLDVAYIIEHNDDNAEVENALALGEEIGACLSVKAVRALAEALFTAANEAEDEAEDEGEDDFRNDDEYDR